MHKFESMPNNSSAIASKLWNYAPVLKNGGGYGDYVEQITYSGG